VGASNYLRDENESQALSHVSATRTEEDNSLCGGTPVPFDVESGKASLDFKL